ncbi:MAG TPA: cytidylate kinase-like family protein [Candidatus Nanopelagicales bacterium]
MSQTPLPAATDLPPVVTIFESYGAGASRVGHRVAGALGLPLHRQAFSSAAIEGDAAGVHAEEAHFLHRMLAVLAATFGPERATVDPVIAQYRQELVAENRRQVAAAASAGGVILGRNAALLLADRPRTLHVLLTGDPQACIERAMADDGITREHAERRQAHEEHIRADMAIALHGWDPRDRAHYDLVANTSRVPLDPLADAIVASVRAAAPHR